MRHEWLAHIPSALCLTPSWLLHAYCQHTQALKWVAETAAVVAKIAHWFRLRERDTEILP